MESKTVAELVDELFTMHLRSDGREYTYQEISEALAGELEPSYIGKLRSGKITNPGRNALLLLCRAFQVPPSYFFPELTALSSHERSNNDLRVALRSYGLNAEAQRYLLGLAAMLRKKTENDPSDEESQ